MGKTAFVFPGQGSQYAGMARQAFETSAEFASWIADASDACGLDLRRLCLEGPEDELRKTSNQQPAILAISVGLLQLVMAAGRVPDVVAGHSLGEYSALVAAGSLSPADAVRLVAERGRIMEDVASRVDGGMAAILGLVQEKIEEACASAHAVGDVQIANLNCPGQVVISGERSALAKALEMAKALGAKRCIPLAVSGPFHSRLMEPVGAELSRLISQVHISDPTVPIVMNYTADYAMSGVDIAHLMVEQVSGAVQWEASIRKMVEDGVSVFVEIGPGKVLSGLIKKIAGTEIETVCVEDMADVSRLLGA